MQTASGGREVHLGPAVAARQLPSGHAAAGEGRDLVSVVNPAHTQDVVLICRVVQRPIQRAVVADCAHHYDAVAGDFPHLLQASRLLDIERSSAGATC